MRNNIDWSQAPLGADWWAVGKLGQAYWFTPSGWPPPMDFWYACSAPTFDYEGDWQDSLTPRPQWAASEQSGFDAGNWAAEPSLREPSVEKMF